jgi:hypothetical protein
MPELYYGVYLIPPPSLIAPLSAAHRLFAGQFSAYTAGRFPVHCTIKGFFKLAPGVTPAAFVPALNALFAATPACPATMTPPWIGGAPQNRGQSILLWLERTPALLALHQAVWDIVIPYVAPDCRFTPGEYHGEQFPPHITLVQEDLPPDPGLLAQIRDLAAQVYAGLPQHTFLAQDMQLVEFEAADWAVWWETLRYRQLQGWRLPGEVDHEDPVDLATREG